MKPWETLDTAVLPDGGELTLARRDTEFALRVRGHVLMTSRAHGSEVALAEIGCGAVKHRSGARVLIGGLGFGYTVRAALDVLGPDAAVTVAELVPAVVAWNRGVLGPLTDHALTDARVSVIEGDVADVIRKHPRGFDAVLLDVDNGPSALTQEENSGLYGTAGLARAREALRPGGVLCVWSAQEVPAFAARLKKAGFGVQVQSPPVHGTRGARHTIFVGTRGR